MALKAGIVGLPNVGKSTLFNAITNSKIEAANYPFATIEPNVGIVELQDKRLDRLTEIVNPKKVQKSTFEFIDIAGLVEGASKGEGLGNKFLTNIRETDAIIQVVRCFDDADITHVSGSVDPIRDMNVINLELILADMETVSKVIKRTERLVRNTKDKAATAEFNVASKLLKAFENEKPARSVELSEDEMKIAKGYQLLSLKPVLYVGNVAEEFVSDPTKSELFNKLVEEANKEGAKTIGISAKIESELVELPEEDREMFLEDLNITDSGLDILTRAAFELLNLATYFTAGVQEVRAWTFNKGMTAPQCAGIIHTDFEKGFIRAEVIDYKDFDTHNGEQGAKEAGKARLEGKEYVMKDGDICHFRFNV